MASEHIIMWKSQLEFISQAKQQCEHPFHDSLLCGGSQGIPIIPTHIDTRIACINPLKKKNELKSNWSSENTTPPGPEIPAQSPT